MFDARSNTPSMGLLGSKKIRRRLSFLKPFFILSLALVFLLNSVGGGLFTGESWAAKNIAGLTSVGPDNAGGPTPLKELSASTFTMPQELGYIQESMDVPDSSKTGPAFAHDPFPLGFQVSIPSALCHQVVNAELVTREARGPQAALSPEIGQPARQAFSLLNICGTCLPDRWWALLLHPAARAGLGWLHLCGLLLRHNEEPPQEAPKARQSYEGPIDDAHRNGQNYYCSYEQCCQSHTSHFLYPCVDPVLAHPRQPGPSIGSEASYIRDTCSGCNLPRLA